MNWKKILLLSFGWGAGTAVCLAAIVGAYLWYESRPKPSKPWSTTAIFSSDDAAGFGSNGGGKEVYLIYTLQNATDTDYEIGPETEIKITFKNSDGSLTEPLPAGTATLRRPVFIPAKQKAMSRLTIAFNNVPQKKTSETDEQYHERLRTFCKEKMGDSGFTLFDEINRYQINLPSVRAQAASPSASTNSSVWRPSWETIPDKTKRPKEHLTPTVAFVDDVLSFTPVLDTDEQKKLHELDVSQKDLFVRTLGQVSECNGISFMRTRPRDADFDIQVFNGLDGRTGKWQWVLYRTDITERLGFGEEPDIKIVARNICLGVRTHR
jgi:hypothetical protein